MKGIIYQLKEFSTNSIVDIKHVIVADTVREEVVKLWLSDLYVPPSMCMRKISAVDCITF